VDLSQALFGDAEVALGFAAAFGSGIAEAGGDEIFALQSLESCVDAAYGDIAAAVAFKFAGDGDAVGFVAEMNDGEKDHEFEFSEIAAVGHPINSGINSIITKKWRLKEKLFLR
jgi:hypothetical protein